MKNVFLVFLCICTALVELCAQTQAFQLDLEKLEEIKHTIFDAENGTWFIISKPESILKNTAEYKILKYAIGADKPSWETKVVMGSGLSQPMYSPDNPTYLYFFDEGKRATKLKVMQISPAGVAKEKECDYKKERLYMGFADEQYFYLLTGTNLEELKLRKYEHDTWKSSVHTLKLPEVEEGQKFEDWTLAGITNAQFSLIRYGKKKSAGAYQVASFDLNTGKLLNKCTYNYDEGKYPMVVGTTNGRFRKGATIAEEGIMPKFGDDYEFIPGQNHSSHFYIENANGNLFPMANNDGYYFLASNTEKRTNFAAGPIISGFILQKLDKSGKLLWSEEVPFTKEELGIVLRSRVGTSIISLTQDQYNDENLVVEYGLVTDTKLWRDSDGRVLYISFDSTTGKRRKTEITDTASGSENHVLPFLPMKTKEMQEYFQKKGIKGKYKSFTSGQSALLTITPKGDKQAVGVIYFK